MENGDFDCEVLSVGTGYHGDNYFYFIELKNGKEIKRNIGFMSENDLNEFIGDN